MKGIADTGFLVAFANRNDRHHDWAVRVAEQVSPPVLTCEAVLAETSFHLQNVGVVLAMIQGRADDGRVRMQRAPSAARSFGDPLRRSEADLADLCLVRVSELHPSHAVITVDQKDFRVYRRNKRKVIPLVVPPR